jgi:hypothetical protein
MTAAVVVRLATILLPNLGQDTTHIADLIRPIYGVKNNAPGFTFSVGSHTQQQTNA